MTTHLVSHIDVRDFGAETLRIGDLNGDGAPDLLLTQSIYETREITCLTALTMYGEILWQRGEPSKDRGRLYSDLPVQIYDWDGDGRNEVLYVTQSRYVELDPAAGWPRERALRYEGQATMLVLDARTGEPRDKIALPAPADDCLLFADLTGRGRREDLVVKDRYWNIWGVAHDGRLLWHYDGCNPGHFPAIADVDDDGRDEVFIGFALIDHDGRAMFELPSHGAHQDATWIEQLPDGQWRLLFGNGGLHCLTPDGTTMWHHPLAEAQHVVAGQFRTDSPLQFGVIDRGQPRGGDHTNRAPATLLLYDLEGNEIWRRAQPEDGWAAALEPIRWLSTAAPQQLLVYSRGPGRAAAIYDGDGQLVDELRMRYSPGKEPDGENAHWYALAADVWGDGREEVLMFGPRGLCIYANARPLQIPGLYNETLYPGM